MVKLTEDQIRARLKGEWELRDGKLCREYKFKNFRGAFAYMSEVATAAEAMNHHPDWSNVYNRVRVELFTHDAGHVTELDLRLADLMEERFRAAGSTRRTEYDIHPMILNRRSERAMSGESMTDEELMPLFDAARWAPSSYNSQVWRFVIARRDTPEWTTLFGLLGEFNQKWCKNASALVVMFSCLNFAHNGKPSRTHSLDAGAAWENLALEGTRRGYVVHGMAGFDYERAASELGAPEDYVPEMMIAVGKPGAPEALPEDLRDREAPSDRKPLGELLFRGRFGAG